MKLNNKIIFALILLLPFVACKRKKVIDCPGFPESHLDWLPYDEGDTIRFTDSIGQQIIFIGKVKYATAFEQRTCRTSFPTPPCECYNYPRAGASAHTNDTSYRKTNSAGKTILLFNDLYVDIYGDETNGFTISYHVLDGTSTYHLNPDIELSGNDILLPSYSVGGQTYSKVVEHTVDTANNPYVDPGLNVNFVYKMYSNKSHGVIAFQDLKSNSFYYRKL